MKTIFLTTLFFCSTSFAQENNDSLINIAIDNFFTGLNKCDTMKILNAVEPEVFEMKSILISKFGNNSRWEDETLNDFLKMLGTPREEIWEERILSRSIHQNGMIAVAWLPYEFYLEGKYSHEGVNMIQFAKFNGEWKMISILDTRQRVEKLVPKE